MTIKTKAPYETGWERWGKKKDRPLVQFARERRTDHWSICKHEAIKEHAQLTGKWQHIDCITGMAA